MGGENLIAAAVAGIGAGSSPHGRGKRSRSESSPPTKAAHPRMGGENLCYKQVTLVSLGSSPHARGKLNGRVDGNLAPGLIPAWAGKTTRSMSAWIIEAAHPRMGGENAPPRAQTVNWMRLIPAWAGKTNSRVGVRDHASAHPRMGGENAPPRAQTVNWMRLIPAWAGKTLGSSISAPTPRAHPRMGGENLCSSVAVVGVEGSSPHGRGKHLGVIPGQAGHRLIPAWAGKTRGGRVMWPAWQAHPRMGGENFGVDCDDDVRAGSSPHGRGKHAESCGGSGPQRPIPAWAGKTLCGRGVVGVVQAHPRMGGENAWLNSWAVISPGSSPRRRGKLAPSGDTGQRPGLIPARAGKTVRSAWCGLRTAAHPRAGGENDIGDDGEVGRRGSSPRGRGKRAAQRRLFRSAGLIPARAGKTP